MEEFVFGAAMDEEDLMHGKYLTFTVEDDVYGIEIAYVTELVGIQSITRVPGMPDYVKGIINLRGKIIPIIDMRLRFKKPQAEYDDRTCIVVMEMGDMPLGLIVDTVLEVADIPDGEIVPPPQSLGVRNRYVKGIGKTPQGVRLLLSCEAIVTDTAVKDAGESEAS